MMLFLTGASSSLASSGGTPQDDPMKSLGGYVSNTLVPNGTLNTLFDLISLKSIKNKTKETIAIALINKFDSIVTDVKLKIVSGQNNICTFKVAAVKLDDNYCMEYINNRYNQPMLAEFHDVTFNPASVDVEIKKLPVPGEEVFFEPFDVMVQFNESTYNHVFDEIKKAFIKDNKYSVKRLNENSFRIEKNDDSVVESFKCSYMSSDDCEFIFKGLFQHINNNEVLISKKIKPNGGIGLWIQREISNIAEKSDSEMIDDYNNKVPKETIEEIELVIDYNIVDVVSMCRVIDKGINFSIKVSNLALGIKYHANLCTEDFKTVISSNLCTEEGDSIRFTWDAEKTELLPSGVPLTLEIFDENRDEMYRKEKFATARNTSAITD